MNHKDVLYALIVCCVVATIFAILFIRYIASEQKKACLYVPLDEIKNNKCLEIFKYERN